MFRILTMLLIVFIVGCTTTGPFPSPTKPAKPLPESQTTPTQPQRPAGPLPPSTRPTYNLSGYPPATREGYIDGCEMAKKTRYGYKDEQRYLSDSQYRMGWDDGFAICQMRR